MLCRVVDFKGAQLEFYRILIGVHAKVLLDPKELGCQNLLSPQLEGKTIDHGIFIRFQGGVEWDSVE